jgi:Uncharacterised nucleotidyltransferase
LVEASGGSERLLAAAGSLHLDAVTAEAVEALRAWAVESILLRGPAIARWLYDDDTTRTYVDVDLLVAHRDLPCAEAALARLGFADLTVEGVLAHDRPTHAHTWARRRDGAAVDLHYTLLGARLEPERVWDVLASATETTSVAGTTVTVLNEPARAVVVALHAAQHGVGVGQPLDDLARALALLPAPVWEAASALATRLDATAAFATGLRLLPPGHELADELDLPVDRSTEAALRASTPPPTALGYDWLARTPGLRVKAGLVAKKIAPDAVFMRAWSPLARRGRAGLVAAYVWRVFWLTRHAGPGFIAWRRARKNGSPRRADV